MWQTGVPTSASKSKMIELYYWPTPNGHKITLFLEESGLPYTIKRVDLGKGEQYAPEYQRIAPNNRMPAIVDHAPADGGAPISVFESGAILSYLADIACYQWIASYAKYSQKLEDFPHLQRWSETIRARPATARAYVQGDFRRTQARMGDEERKVLSGRGKSG
jgi:glutathione S-transferase